MGPVRGNKQSHASSHDSDHDSEDDDYRMRRERNNLAVRKSREKSRSLARHTAQRISELRNENTKLESTIGTLAKELKLLKDVLVMRSRKKRRVSVSSDDGESVVVVEEDNIQTTVQHDGHDTVQKDHVYASTRIKR